MPSGSAGELPRERAGRVVDRDGAPMADAVVAVVDSSVPIPEIALIADAEGRFHLRLPDGRFRLRAHAGERVGEAEAEAPSVQEIVIVVDG